MEAGTNEGCVFCKIAEGKVPAEKVYENKGFFSVPDINPKVEGHSLIISKKHFKTSLDIPESLGSDFFDCVKNTALKLMENNNSEGFNIINNNFSAAGQIVNHVHFHILPRKEKDGLKVID